MVAIPRMWNRKWRMLWRCYCPHADMQLYSECKIYRKRLQVGSYIYARDNQFIHIYAAAQYTIYNIQYKWLIFVSFHYFVLIYGIIWQNWDNSFASWIFINWRCPPSKPGEENFRISFLGSSETNIFSDQPRQIFSDEPKQICKTAIQEQNLLLKNEDKIIFW